MKEYFSHDYNARNDKKLVKLHMKHGVAGIGIYWCIIEMLYEESGYLSIDEYERITFELRCNLDVVKSIVNDFDLFKINNNKFHSKTALDRLNERMKKSEKARESVMKRWSKYERNTTVEQTKNGSNTIKVKESKEKNSKVNKIPLFEDFLKHALSKEPLISEKHLKLKYDSWIENNWKDGHDKKISNWKSKLTNTIPYIQKDNSKNLKSLIPDDGIERFKVMYVGSPKWHIHTEQEIEDYCKRGHTYVNDKKPCTN